MSTIVLDPKGQRFTIVRFRDGDTLEGYMQCKVCECARELVVRLRKIDSWELHKPEEKARAQMVAAHATELYRGKEGIFVGNPTHRDKYGRTIGDIFIGGEFLTNLLVFQSLAWYIPATSES